MHSRTREGFYALWTLAILICLGVCIFLLIWVSFADGGETAGTPAPDAQAQVQAADGTVPAGDGAVPAEDGIADGGAVPAEDGAVPAEDGTVPDEGVQTQTAPSSVTLGETADAGQDYLNRLIFLGDSTTYGLYSYGLLPHYQVWTPASGTLSLFNYAIETIDYYTPGGGETSQGLPIMDCAANAQPEYLVITLGLNGISILDEEQFKQYYSSLIRDVLYASPNTKIICNSIYPVIDGLADSSISNERINAANGWIQDVAASVGARYLNSHDALTDDTGNLAIENIGQDSDGIHMNADGYSALLQYVRTHAWQ